MEKKLLLLLILIGVVGYIQAVPLGKSATKATHIRPQQRSVMDNLRRLFVLPNTYYDIPRHRYPYYDEKGTGRLLYGYGGRTLYKYSIFKPLEGYY